MKNIVNRRDFVKGAAAISVGAVLIPSSGVFAQGTGKLKVALVGCGGRGKGALGNILEAGPEVDVGDVHHGVFPVLVDLVRYDSGPLCLPQRHWLNQVESRLFPEAEDVVEDIHQVHPPWAFAAFLRCSTELLHGHQIVFLTERIRMDEFGI